MTTGSTQTSIPLRWDISYNLWHILLCSFISQVPPMLSGSRPVSKPSLDRDMGVKIIIVAACRAP